MAWFSSIKGHYPSLGQVDLTRPLTIESGKTVERGSIVKLDGATDTFKQASAGDTALLFISLQDVTDAQAGMAGTVPFGGAVSNSKANITLPVAGQPVITGLSMAQAGEYETDMFDTSATYTVGEALKVGTNGKLTADSAGTNAVAYVTKVPFNRWINDAVAAPSGASIKVATRTGASRKVLQFVTK